ncbi:hypothetical protein P5673_021347, partial [Acropora cervicornis]
YSEFMKKKSVIIGLPVVPYNQSKHSDVCQYLEYVQKLLVDIYKPQYIWEQLYKPTAASGRKDTGTLYHLRQHFGLVNVPSRVLDNYSSCSVVILLQKSEDYKVLAVGKVIEVDAHISVPEKHVPVFVASIEECASGILAPGSAVFWPTDLIAVYKSPTMETAEISQPSNSNLNTYGLKECCTQYDNECGIHPESTKHTHACTTEDVKAMLAVVQQAKPFQYQRGRKLYSFPNVTKSPLDQLDVALLNTWLTNHKRKLFSGIHDCNEEDNDEENELSNGDDNTPEEDDLDD